MVDALLAALDFKMNKILTTPLKEGRKTRLDKLNYYSDIDNMNKQNTDPMIKYIPNKNYKLGSIQRTRLPVAQDLVNQYKSQLKPSSHLYSTETKKKTMKSTSKLEKTPSK
jgi:hypothetical protein